MTAGRPSHSDLEFHPLTRERLADFESLFGESGACGGCWCMFLRLAARDFDASRGDANRNAMGKLVRGGATPGILAYRDGEPIGWCAVEPREAYPRLARSRVMKPVDATRAWMVTCFFVRKDQRRRGVSEALLRAAAEHVQAAGGDAVDACPIDSEGDMADAFAWQGKASMFRRVGFREVARRSPTRPYLRLELG